MDAASPPRLAPPLEPLRAPAAADVSVRAEPVKPADAADNTTQQQTTVQAAPERLVVEKDQAAGRFVQTWLDGQTLEVERRYPNEAQLAYSRAVGAYLRALSES